ncbi:recombinase family protein [Brevibacillus ginsengisoli]|uniref:recombinase family protein n=1 Tax=Brevibacillus ginsengisoli TaxID=363854 RepID=UPI003CF56341
MDKVKVAAYCRVSTSTKDQLNSFENQQTYFQREISKKPEWELIEIYADKGLSGTTMNKRKEFLRMLYDAGVDWQIIKGKVVLTSSEREPKFNRIMVSNTSRFARNILSIDALRELKARGVYIDFLDSNKSSENESDEVFIQMLISFAEQESRDKSIKVRFGQKESAEKGVIFTNKTIFGYRYIPKENILEIIPEEAEIIITIFDLYVSGEGIRRIIDILDERGMKTRDGKSFAKSTISSILSQRKYCGDLVRNKYTFGEFLNKHNSYKIKPKDEWIIHEDVIPAIVSKEVFQKAQEIRDGKIHTKLQRGINKGKSDFAGKIKCETCGNHYIRNVDRGRAFYNCSLKKAKGVNACSSKNINEKYLNDIVEEMVTRVPEMILKNKSNTIKMLERFKDELLKSIDQDKTELVRNLSDKLKELEGKKVKLLDLYLDDSFDKHTLSKKALKIDEEIINMKKEIQENSRNNDEINAEAGRINQQIISIRDLKTKEYSIDEVKNMLRFEVQQKTNGNFLFVTVNSFNEIQFNYNILGQYQPYSAVMDKLKYGIVTALD